METIRSAVRDERLWDRWVNDVDGEWDSAKVLYSVRLMRKGSLHQYVQHFCKVDGAPETSYIAFQMDKNKLGRIKFKHRIVRYEELSDLGDFGGFGNVLEKDIYDEPTSGPTIGHLKQLAETHQASSQAAYGAG